MNARRLISLAWFALAPFGVVAACGAPSTHPPAERTDTDGSAELVNVPHGNGSDAGAGGALEDTAGQCNNLQASTVQADVDYVGPNNEPQPAGGSISDGLFQLSTYKVYANNSSGGTGKTGAWFKEFLRFSGNAFEIVSETDQASRTRKSGTWSLDTQKPNTLVLHFSCPDTSDFPTGYTASATQVQLLFASGGGTSVLTYVAH